jgi:hypothetical protein
MLETFNNKKGKYLFRNDDGLRIYRTVTNNTTAPKGCERFVVCDLPLKFHLVRLIYGVKVGQMLASR